MATNLSLSFPMGRTKAFHLHLSIAKKNAFKMMEVPCIEKAQNFNITLDDGEIVFGLGTYKYLVEEGGKVILGTRVSSELYVLNENRDALQYITFNSQLTLNEKSGSYPPIVET